MNDEVRHRLIQYENVTRQFQKYFDSEDLNLALSRKADTALLDQIQEQNASINDIMETQNNLATLNVRLKHLSILTSEVARSMLPTKSHQEHFNTKMIRGDQLHQ